MALVYVPNNDIGWCPAELIERTGNEVSVRLLDINGLSLPEKESILLIDVETPLQNIDADGNPDTTSISDLTTLGHLHEASILYNLRRRHSELNPYTYVGEIVLAVNPYQWLPLYSEEIRQQYARSGGRRRGGGGQGLAPHVYSVSVTAYQRMSQLRNGVAQSILVSGESGAGKTETTKIMMGHMAAIASGIDGSHHHETIEAIIKSNPLLESFGNARTSRNDNSSRFGKFIQLQFGDPCIIDREFSSETNSEKTKTALLGALSKTYLLEKTRILTQTAGERNYHIFYQLLAGLHVQELGQLHLQPLPAHTSWYQYLRNDSDGQIEGKTDKQHFQDTCEALSLIQISEDQQRAMWRLLAGILRLGEICFNSQREVEAEGGAPAVEMKAGDDVASLLGVETHLLGKALTERSLIARGESYSVRLSEVASINCRDALAKHLYTSLFDWLVSRINSAIGTKEFCEKEMDNQTNERWIGLLDIFGFENFEFNSYEQLMINYANEKLQQKFTSDVFTTMQREYIEEGLRWEDITYQDNSAQVVLLEGKGGIIEAMNEEIRTTGQDSSLVQKLKASHSGSRNTIRFPRGSSKTDAGTFTILHYAGGVTYDASHGTGFLAKHKDALFPDLKRLLTTSKLQFMTDLFSDESFASFSVAPLLHGKGGPNPTGRSRRMSALGAISVGTQFKQSLSQLLSVLSTSESQYVRCVKPNTRKLSAGQGDGRGGTRDSFDMKMVSEQLRCAGVVEAVRVARSAYPNRVLLRDFIERFRFLNKQSKQKEVASNSGNDQNTCVSLLTSLDFQDITDFQVGKTKVYFRGGVLESLEAKHFQRTVTSALLLQAAARMFLQRNRFRASLRAIIRVQANTRRWTARARLIQVKTAVVKCQSTARCLFARRSLRNLRRNFKGTRLQSWYRCLKQSYLYGKTRRDIVVVQKIARGKAGRERFKEAQEEAKRQSDATLQVAHLHRLLEEQRIQTDALRQRLDDEVAAAQLAAETTQRKLQISSVEANEDPDNEVKLLREALWAAKQEAKANLLVASNAPGLCTDSLQEAHILTELRTENQRLSLEAKDWRVKYNNEMGVSSQLRERCDRLSNSLASKEASILEGHREVALLKRSLESVAHSQPEAKHLSTTPLKSVLKSPRFIKEPAKKLSQAPPQDPAAFFKGLIDSTSTTSNEQPSLDLCQTCLVNDEKNIHQLIHCTLCDLLFHTHCAKGKRIPFSLSESEKDHRNNFIKLNLSNFMCAPCASSASSSRGGAPISRRAKGDAARAQRIKEALKRRKPSKKAPPMSNLSEGSTESPSDLTGVVVSVKELSPLEVLEAKLEEKENLIQSLTQETKKHEKKLSDKHRQLETALEAQRCAEALAEDSNSRADFACERLGREQALWEKEQEKLAEMGGVLIAPHELNALRLVAENFESEISEVKAECAELKAQLSAQGGERRGFFRRRPSVTAAKTEETLNATTTTPSQQGDIFAELALATEKAALSEKDVARDQLLNKTAEQLHEAMNVRLRLELLIEERDQQLSEKTEENETLNRQLACLKGGDRDITASTPRGRLRSIFSLGRGGN